MRIFLAATSSGMAKEDRIEAIKQRETKVFTRDIF